MAAARFLSPMDWQEVGCRHAITFEWPGDGPPPPVLVFAKDPLVRWLRTGSLGTPPQPIVTLAAVRVREALCIAEPVRDLPVGDHILALRSAEDAPFAVVSGVRIADTPRHWGELLPQLVAARRQLGALRTDLPRGVPDAPLFAITTTVFDTDPQFLDELFDCLSRQDHGDFEWLLLDNGSTRADTVQRLRDFAARDPRIRHFRVDDNIHIIPGNRYLLQRARGRYIVPVDSDDLVHADALALFAEQLRGEQPPEILFSEECKVTQDGRAAEYVWRPGFSRLFALATCPAAHLMAFERQMVLRVKAYDDDYAQGSHDWDTTLRLMVAGGRAVRVPHILYGWRMHPGSSAASSEAKDYLRSSQVAVLAHAVARLGLQDRFEVQPTETGHLGYYHLHRRAIAPRPLAVDFVLRGGSDAALDDLGHNLGQLDYPDLQIRVLVPSLIATDALHAAVLERVQRAGTLGVEISAWQPDQLGAAVSAVPDGVHAKAIVDCSMRLQRRDWLWDAVGTFELDPASGVVGGRILDRSGFVQHIGYYSGLEGFVATPNHGEPPGAVYGHLAYVRRGVTAVHSGLLVVRADVFRRAGPLLDVDTDDGIYGVEFCMRCATVGIGVAYTPRVDAVRAAPLQLRVGAWHPLRSLLLTTYPQLRATDPFYTSLLGDMSATFGLRLPGDGAASSRIPPLLHKLVRGATALASSARDTARHVLRGTIGLVRNRPVRVRTSFQVPSTQLPARVGSNDQANGTIDRTSYLPPTGLLSPADPLHLVIADHLAKRPTLNVLLPGIAMHSMSGGPNTVLNLAYRMAAKGVPIRFVSTEVPLDIDMQPVWEHVCSLSGIKERLPNVEFVAAVHRRQPVPIGREDVFLASAWWTAQMVKYALPTTRPQRFLYVIQDFEAVLHEHSTLHALALETYDLDFVPFVNHRFLADYLRQQAVGRFADAEFAARCTVIDPAIDRTRFFPELERASGPRRLLFYARPRSGKRNLFELGVAALQRAAQFGAFAHEPWEFLAIGDKIEAVALGNGHTLRPAPWLEFDDYARQMRRADLLLSLMLSPHPSYPPLEMAACGGLVVTNAYGGKTQARFSEISPNILAPKATIEGISDGLLAAAARVGDLERRRRGSQLPVPASWDESFVTVLPRAIAAFTECRGVRS